MPLLLDEQRTAEWHRLHQGRITASIAAACLGLCPYTSRQKAWRTILGTEDRSGGNRHTNWGVEFEPAARAAYEVETGNLVEETGLWVHPLHDWLAASPDGLVGPEGLFECKCPSRLPDCVPIHHRIQMLVQLAVTERAWCDYFCWSQNGTFLRRVHHAGIGNLVEMLRRFREEFVLTETEPPRKKPRRRTKTPEGE